MINKEIFMDPKFETPSTSVPKEGPITKTIEKQTAKIPSAVFLGLAGSAVAVSLGLAVAKEKKGIANFIGLWVPSILLLGIYNKIVKTEGSDQQEKYSLH
jgi:hypothetical protein